MNAFDSSIRLKVNAAIVRNNKILVIEFNDKTGIHYNLPGGGLDLGESIEDALRRECREEACADVKVGRLLLLWEYLPTQQEFKFGPRQRVGHIFECHLQPGSVPSMPKSPDKNQIGVRWIPLAEIKSSQSPRVPPLFPTVGNELITALENSCNPI